MSRRIRVVLLFIIAILLFVAVAVVPDYVRIKYYGIQEGDNVSKSEKIIPQAPAWRI